MVNKNMVAVFCICIIVLGISAFIQVAPKPTAAAIGKKLFNDKILSKDQSISCASCHIPERGFADTIAFSFGIYKTPTTRNTPSVLNMKFRPYFFWDGRAETLEQQSLMPIAHANEMGLPINEAVERLNANANYIYLFKQVFNAKPSAKNIGIAIAAFEKTLETGQSKFDESFNGKAKLTASEERGRKLFISDKTKCFDCHRGDDFTTDEFKNIGLYNGNNLNDVGRYAITKDSADIGKFKTPGLRNVAITAPYMHNGMFATLEQVVEYYNNPGAFVPDAINIDEVLQAPLGLTKQEKTDLVAFLKTLTDKRFSKSK
jgi:cytochrome c peroxidase